MMDNTIILNYRVIVIQNVVLDNFCETNARSCLHRFILFFEVVEEPSLTDDFYCHVVYNVVYSVVLCTV